MLKTQIVYTDRLPTTKQVDELKQLIPLDITWTKYRGTIKVNGTTALDWTWLKTLYTEKVDVQCFLMEQKELKKLSIKSHIGLYNLDNDNVHDFYISLPRYLDDRAKLNGFKSNFAWIFIHEFLHGVYWNKTKSYALADSEVHAGEKQGKLKDMLQQHLDEQKQIEELTIKLTWLQSLLAMLKSPSHPTKIQPTVERRVISIITDMERFGLPVRLVQGYRSIEEQNKLYAQGRTTVGAIVTNAKGGESFHNYGVAVDFVFRKSGYNATDAQWELLGKTGEKYGFSWGGRWKGFIDKPHFEMTLGYSLKDFQTGKVDYTKFN